MHTPTGPSTVSAAGGPPTARFLLAFIGLVTTALCLAALSPAREPARHGAAALEPRVAAPGTKGVETASADVTSPVR